ncbi:MAG: cyclic nucleotide-binding domain-containing protein [Prosthecobacter sp.]
MSEAGSQILRPARWDEPFDAEVTPERVALILTLPPFDRLDPQRFPRHLPLEGILRNDTRLLTLKRDQIIVREGDYGNSAFLVLEGTARVVLDSLPREVLGRGEGRKKGWFQSIARALGSRRVRELRPHHTIRQREADQDELLLLHDVPRVLSGKHTNDLQPGEMFGEIAALGRSPRTATVIAAEDGTTMLEIRWQGLRDMMSHAPEMKAHIEERFRKHGLRSLLQTLDIIRRLPQDEVDAIVEATEFERHGRMDWYGSYQQLLDSTTPAQRLRNEPMILQQGDYLNGLVIVRGGFVRVSRKHHMGEQTTAYLGKGQCYGLKEIFQNAQKPDGLVTSEHSLRAVGYVDVLVIPTVLVEKLILPRLTSEEIRKLEPQVLKRKSGKEADLGEGAREKLGPGIVEFFMDKRTINGSAAMLIDLDRCTRCDDCVRACADAHDGNPRFIRHGDRLEGIQITQACMHCHDPICMIPCPTGAIHREESGEVVINDRTCIGCTSCANNCPYNNIQMVEIRDENGMPQFPVRLDAKQRIVFDSRGAMTSQSADGAVQRATKCDLCYDLPGGPACARACPHDALIRLDMQETDKLAAWLNR